MSNESKLRRAIFYCSTLDEEVEIKANEINFCDVVDYCDGTIREIGIEFTCVCGKYHEVKVKN